MEYHWIILLLPAFFARSHGSCGAPPRLDFAGLDPEFIDKDNFPLDARVNYTCRPGFIKIPGTQNFITCLSGSTWSTPQTFCQRRQCPSPTDIPNGKMEITDTLFGSRVNYTCDLGYRMLTKRNYIECQADGTWSTPVPVCEVQVCPPPDAIPDGRYDPDEEEYNYQAAIKYSCLNNKATLIGESTLSCTAYGNWSSDPPRCKVVECLNPDVKNARKISGFIGPYILNSAVRFECLPGFIMDGEPFVRCNVSDQWEPPLPTCRSSATTRSPTTTTKVKETEKEGIVTQSPATTKTTNTVSNNSSPATTKKKETETGDGSNVGAIVGGVIGGIFGILLAAFICVWWFKRKGKHINYCHYVSYGIVDK
ncbi:membrane cofactor protein-like isoform X3 [Hyla sarda]|uniref:membrane cofactor protein-like isoform X3 n=1 Tax=Hyla sarda TaxID=327740 RepID=UPI0024C43D28|nr:membrane cofactor protein-like isoform X3 [Hyla sarda]